jgi:hypothetical protein
MCIQAQKQVNAHPTSAQCLGAFGDRPPVGQNRKNQAERVKTQDRNGSGESISPSRSNLVIGRESISVMPRERNPILSANFESEFPHGLQELRTKSGSLKLLDFSGA